MAALILLITERLRWCILPAGRSQLAVKRQEFDKSELLLRAAATF
jgi:hypothetical protein